MNKRLLLATLLLVYNQNTDKKNESKNSGGLEGFAQMTIPLDDDAFQGILGAKVGSAAHFKQACLFGRVGIRMYDNDPELGNISGNIIVDFPIFGHFQGEASAHLRNISITINGLWEMSPNILIGLQLTVSCARISIGPVVSYKTMRAEYGGTGFFTKQLDWFKKKEEITRTNTVLGSSVPLSLAPLDMQNTLTGFDSTLEGVEKFLEFKTNADPKNNYNSLVKNYSIAQIYDKTLQHHDTHPTDDENTKQLKSLEQLLDEMKKSFRESLENAGCEDEYNKYQQKSKDIIYNNFALVSALNCFGCSPDALQSFQFNAKPQLEKTLTKYKEFEESIFNKILTSKSYLNCIETELNKDLFFCNKYPLARKHILTQIKNILFSIQNDIYKTIQDPNVMQQSNADIMAAILTEDKYKENQKALEAFSDLFSNDALKAFIESTIEDAKTIEKMDPKKQTEYIDWILENKTTDLQKLKDAFPQADESEIAAIIAGFKHDMEIIIKVDLLGSPEEGIQDFVLNYEDPDKQDSTQEEAPKRQKAIAHLLYNAIQETKKFMISNFNAQLKSTHNIDQSISHESIELPLLKNLGLQDFVWPLLYNQQQKDNDILKVAVNDPSFLTQELKTTLEQAGNKKNIAFYSTPEIEFIFTTLHEFMIKNKQAKAAAEEAAAAQAAAAEAKQAEELAAKKRAEEAASNQLQNTETGEEKQAAQDGLSAATAEKEHAEEAGRQAAKAEEVARQKEESKQTGNKNDLSDSNSDAGDLTDSDLDGNSETEESDREDEDEDENETDIDNKNDKDRSSQFINDQLDDEDSDNLEYTNDEELNLLIDEINSDPVIADSIRRSKRILSEYDKHYSELSANITEDAKKINSIDLSDAEEFLQQIQSSTEEKKFLEDLSRHQLKLLSTKIEIKQEELSNELKDISDLKVIGSKEQCTRFDLNDEDTKKAFDLLNDIQNLGMAKRVANIEDLKKGAKKLKGKDKLDFMAKELAAKDNAAAHKARTERREELKNTGKILSKKSKKENTGRHNKKPDAGSSIINKQQGANVPNYMRATHSSIGKEVKKEELAKVQARRIAGNKRMNKQRAKTDVLMALSGQKASPHSDQMTIKARHSSNTTGTMITNTKMKKKKK